MKKHILIALVIMFLFSACGPKNSYEGYMSDGVKKAEKGDYDGAIKSYKKAVEFEPNSAVIYNLLGMAYRFKYNTTRDRKYFDLQVKSFQKSISLDPSYYVAMINLATAYYYGNHKKEAIPLFKRSIELNPDHPEKYEIQKMIDDFEKEEKAK